MTKKEFEAQAPEQKHAINPNANLADIGTIVSEAISHDEAGEPCSVRDCLLDLHSMIYPNSSYTASPEELAALAAFEPCKTCIHPESSECVAGCYDCDPESAPVAKRAGDEIKLLNLKSYSYILHNILEDAATGASYRLPGDSRVIDGGAWDACFTTLQHIDDTLAELLPE